MRAPTRGGFVPRVQAGFGYYDFKFEMKDNTNDLLLDSYSDGRFGMFFGGGLDYLVAENLSVGVVGNYHFISLNQPNPTNTEVTLITGLGDWYDTWDIKAVVSLYTH